MSPAQAGQVTAIGGQVRTPEEAVDRTFGLVASDLDGTLLDADGTLTARTRRALAAVHEAGVPVVLATGRPTRFTREVARELGIAVPVVCSNGAVIYDPAGDRVLSSRTLTPTLVRELAHALRVQVPGVTFAAESPWVFGCEPRFAETSEWPLPADVIVDAHAWVDGQPIAKLLVRHDVLTTEELAAAAGPVLDGQVGVTFSTGSLIELGAVGVDKSTGLAEVSAALGADAEDSIAFGDMPNDVAMLQWAGHGVAVANAHAQVLAVADAVTARNTDEGVAVYLERFWPVGP